MRVTLKSGEPFAFAGIWEYWRNPDGEIVQSCTIITAAANDLVRPIHDRMPVILPMEVEDFWLDEDVQDAGALCSVPAPYPAGVMDMYEVSSLVNRPSNDVPEVIAPAGRQAPPVLEDHAGAKRTSTPRQQRLPSRSDSQRLAMHIPMPR